MVGAKQNTLVSGTTIKTINGSSILGSGDLVLATDSVQGPASSTNGSVPVFQGTTGKVLTDSGKPLPAGALVGNTDTQTLTNKTISSSPLISSTVLRFLKVEEQLTTINSTGSVTLDLNVGSVFLVNMNANTTLTFTNPHGTGYAGSFTLITKNDATAGRTLAFPASVKWAGGAIPPRTTAANALDIWWFTTSDGGTTWYGSLSIADGK
jgi:hypothetical protein